MLKSPNITIDHEKLQVKGEFNVLFLGFGWQGQELLKKCVCDSQFVGSNFRATIIDKDFETLHGDYLVLFDKCIRQSESYRIRCPVRDKMLVEIEIKPHPTVLLGTECW